MRQFLLSQVLFLYNFVIIWAIIILSAPVVLMSERLSLRMSSWVGHRGINAGRWLTGIEYELRGQEHIPHGASLVAVKHQSAWETGALLCMIPNMAFVVRKEFFYFTPNGWLCWRANMFGVDRGGHAASMRKLLRWGAVLKRANRPIVVFPEGTRKMIGAPPDYKSGVAGLYTFLDLPCVPVALNSGLCWPRNALVKRRGQIVIEFLPPIPAGLQRKDFMHRLQHEIETHTNRLVAQGRAHQKT